MSWPGASAMPWERVEKNYEFEGRGGKETLADLFDGRSQLIVYHFMLAPGWKEGCPGCSFLGDHFDGAIPHVQRGILRLWRFRGHRWRRLRI